MGNNVLASQINKSLHLTFVKIKKFSSEEFVQHMYSFFSAYEKYKYQHKILVKI